MNLFRRFRVWWEDLFWIGETQDFIDKFIDVYTASGGPKPMGKRRPDETMSEYRARYSDWLTAPGVYPDFDRRQNHLSAELLPGEPIHVGIDFNVYNCTAVIAVVRLDCPVGAVAISVPALLAALIVLLLFKLALEVGAGL
ncbi:hypothetical protein R82526_00754 [Ralstonia mannitolilytica]|uniref:hypothetical protein n=1 Tax=Ralstonia mannitolilytica TaxID=105219 RepID=UPI0028F55983|nr:hypothetical protein [Ralstonia mannitolilytica]CAJ0680510.1 hypothetical protein R82526_00754 [Ralstonia mannitolilytica]